MNTFQRFRSNVRFSMFRKWLATHNTPERMSSSSDTDNQMQYERTILTYFRHLVVQNGAEIQLFQILRLIQHAEEDTEPSEFNSEIRELCELTGVDYLPAYQYILNVSDTSMTPYTGFLNTELGLGHLNPLGHKLVASALYRPLLTYIPNSSTTDQY
jgi:hypothetical protein